MPFQRTSRFVRKQEARSLRRAILFGFLTVILALGLVFLGIPALIKMAIFIGNLRSSYTPVESEDNLPPIPPRLKPLPEATNQDQVDIQGYTETGATVELFLNGIPQEKIVAETDGSFSFSNLKLVYEKNEVYALATDQAGNTSQESDILTIYLDKTPPPLTITNPSNESSFSIDEKTIKVTGETEQDATVYVNDHLVIVDSEGKFETPFTLAEGENLIKIVAADKAGNQTEVEFKVKRE